MTREISTYTINSDIQKIFDSSNITDGVNTFYDLYETIMIFIKAMIMSDNNLRLSMSGDMSKDIFKLHIRCAEPYEEFDIWNMEFPIRYMDIVKEIF